MVKKLVIIGAGGFGRETAEIARRIIDKGESLEIAGFLDNNQEMHNKIINGIPVLGDITWNQQNKVAGEEYHFVCAIGDPDTKEQVVKKALELNYLPYTLVDPTVIIGRDVEIGLGSIICPEVILTCNITVKNHVIINQICSIGHDVVISDYCTINPLSAISGGVKIDEKVMIGTHSSILQYLEIGKGSIVAAGACVIAKVPENVLVAGVPAQIKKKRTK